MVKKVKRNSEPPRSYYTLDLGVPLASCLSHASVALSKHKREIVVDALKFYIPLALPKNKLRVFVPKNWLETNLDSRRSFVSGRKYKKSPSGFSIELDNETNKVLCHASIEIGIPEREIIILALKQYLPNVYPPAKEILEVAEIDRELVKTNS
ncbi:hypothetical protein PCC6912_50820 [Chlorogloeopsis fritschii PCC 6912]|uniref:Uncharacterized protein n=1 Tax=Chlorogloeopsis fritschii PCC 6912 TaxID=211165 RepID=A0A3S0Y2C6_CHLFR|nr:hypothetical protein PCC6912_50820 [Chlorogloeopsis fritschii PCC 6912]